MKDKTPTAIRVSVTPEVGRALKYAKKLYPTLSDPEILKLGLSKVVASDDKTTASDELADIRTSAAQALGYDYLSDADEDDAYKLGMGKKVTSE